MTTAADAIREAMAALSGEAEIRDVRARVRKRHPRKWADVATEMADRTYPGNASSLYRPEDRFLVRVSRRGYRLR